MDISFNDDQKEIANQARRFLENETPLEYVREMFEDDKGYTDEIWAKMAEMGWMGLKIPEEYHGIGLGLTDLCIVLEEMGRALLPGPYFSTVMLAAEIIMIAGSDDQKKDYLPKIARGEMKATLALYEPDGGAEPGYIQMKAAADGDDYVLNGAKVGVPDAAEAEIIIVAARTAKGDDPDNGVTLFVVDGQADGMEVTKLKTMDGTRKQGQVSFNNVKASAVLGQVNNGWAALAPVLGQAQMGICAENVGGAQKAMEVAVDYAKIRHQFGQPIGSYQAIKHACAEMLVEVEGARSLMYYAAWAQEHEDANTAALAASAAKAFSSDAYRNVTAKGIQILGGIGITWEHDMHLYLKRAKYNQMTLGDSSYHREQIMKHLGV